MGSCALAAKTSQILLLRLQTLSLSSASLLRARAGFFPCTLRPLGRGLPPWSRFAYSRARLSTGDRACIQSSSAYEAKTTTDLWQPAQRALIQLRRPASARVQPLSQIAPSGLRLRAQYLLA